MPMFGGLTPFPLRMGGGVPRLQNIVESLQLARGEVYSTSIRSAVYIENNAIARAIDRDAYGCNERLANQFYPGKTSSVTAPGIGRGLLSRWETIFSIVPSPGKPDPLRRATLMASWERVVGSNDASGIYDTVVKVLQPQGVFVGLVYQDPNPETTIAPGSNGVTLPQATVYVASTTGFPTEGIVVVDGSYVAYTGIVGGVTPNFTGCTGGTATLATGDSLASTETASWWPYHPNPFPNPFIPTPWYSTICHVNIQVQQPSGMPEGTFLNLLSQAVSTLDSLLPSWVTFDWFVGPLGFYLDSYENLLREAFDE